jgi:hypothetical protein
MLNFCCIMAAILKMANGRNFSMSGINSGYHYLPTYQILMISDNVEFVWYCGGNFENKIWPSDRSPLEEQFCVFKISRCLPFSKCLPKYGIKNGR